MRETVRYSAPWGGALWGMTALAVGTVLMVVTIGLTTGPREMPLWTSAMVVMPLGLLVSAAPFMVRGYEVSPDHLDILRPGWRVSLDLTRLLSVEADPDAMKGSIRLFGNGGLFCFAGLFRNRKLGNYRAFATAPKRAVVLKFEGRTVVVTPDDPEGFAEAVRRTVGVE